jgi:hypothetical protein
MAAVSCRVAWLLLALLALLAVLVAWALRSGRIAIPEAWNPWAPLRIDAPPNLPTRYKLLRASADPAACRAALAQADMRLVPLEDRRARAGRVLRDRVRQPQRARLRRRGHVLRGVPA